MGTRYCPACGRAAETETYCTHCGAVLQPAAEPRDAAETPTVVATEAPRTQPRLRRPWIVVIGIVAVLLAGGAGYALMASTSTSASTPIVSETPAASARPSVAATTSARPARPVKSPIVAPVTSVVAGAWAGTLDQPGHPAGAGQDQVDPMTYLGSLTLADDGTGRITGHYADYQTQGSLNPQSFDVTGTYTGGALDLQGVEGTQDLPPGDAFFMNHLVLSVQGDRMTGVFYKPNGTYMGTVDFARTAR